MNKHPGIEVVSRDRFTNYANGIRNASSTIVQVADRWHLLKNLGDAMQKVLDRNVIKLKTIRNTQPKPTHSASEESVVCQEDDSVKEGVLIKSSY